jgi:hypothetical protein
MLIIYGLLCAIAICLNLRCIEQKCDEIGHRLDAIQKRVDEEELARRQLQEIKQSLAQIVGQLDRFQEDHIDAIVTHDLESGKEAVRLQRKRLTARCLALRERAMALYTAIEQQLAQPE